MSDTDSVPAYVGNLKKRSYGSMALPEEFSGGHSGEDQEEEEEMDEPEFTPPVTLFQASERSMHEPPGITFEDLEFLTVKKLSVRYSPVISTEMVDMDAESSVLTTYLQVVSRNRMEATVCQNNERQRFYSGLERALDEDLGDLTIDFRGMTRNWQQGRSTW